MLRVRPFAALRPRPELAERVASVPYDVVDGDEARALAAGQSVVVVEDVVTTGGSSLRAIEHIEAAGLQVKRVLAIIDRLTGGREAFAEKGYELTTLLTIRDLGIPEG